MRDIVKCKFQSDELGLESLFKKYSLDKDVCVELVKFLRSQPGYKKSTFFVIFRRWRMAVYNRFKFWMLFKLRFRIDSILRLC